MWFVASCRLWTVFLLDPQIFRATSNSAFCENVNDPRICSFSSVHFDLCRCVSLCVRRSTVKVKLTAMCASNTQHSIFTRHSLRHHRSFVSAATAVLPGAEPASDRICREGRCRQAPHPTYWSLSCSCKRKQKKSQKKHVRDINSDGEKH